MINQTQQIKKIRRRLEGVVVSDKTNKTRVVAVTRLKKHPKYHKYYKVTKRYKTHDEKNEYKVGDKVVIQETRPLSKEKRWVVIRKL
jgi:small subunit ribosomal protein S17